jgi:uncharacterized protein
MPFRWDAGRDVMLLAVRLTPKASADRLQAIAQDAQGARHLKIQVTAVPEDGKANKALIKLLSKALKYPKTSLSIVSGATDRTKVIALSGERARLEDSLRAVLERL